MLIGHNSQVRTGVTRYELMLRRWHPIRGFTSHLTYAPPGLPWATSAPMPEATPTLLIVETTAGEPPAEFLGDTAGIVYFISMAHGVRYGADHPLAKAAALITTRVKIKIAPLLNFGDARADTSEQIELLQRI